MRALCQGDRVVARPLCGCTGVDKRSVDTWVNPRQFRMDVSTGAPPDYFDRNGQNWGFPTYNWEEMAKDGYAWWQQRLRHMSQYVSAHDAVGGSLG